MGDEVVKLLIFDLKIQSLQIEFFVRRELLKHLGCEERAQNNNCEPLPNK